MRNISCLALSMILFTAGCASVHSGKYSEENRTKTSSGFTQNTPSRSGLLISGAENRSLSSEHFGSFDFTFENTTDRWIRVSEVTVDMGSPENNDKVIIVVGKDLAAWSEAAQQRAAISDYNTSLFWGSLAAVGGAAALTSKDPSVKGVGAFAAIGSGTALSVNSIRKQLSDLERSKLVPSNHLYSEDFIVPPKLHAKKWVTLYTQKPFDIPYQQKIVVKYKTDKGEYESATIPFRTINNPSDWQRGHPEIKQLKKLEGPK